MFLIGGFFIPVLVIAVLLSRTLGDDFLLWWTARDWSPARCTVLRADSNSNVASYRYDFGGTGYESSAIGVETEGFAASLARTTPVGAELDCWVNPRDPLQALLDRDYVGWWWLPCIWSLAALMFLSVLMQIPSFWRWLTYSPEPPLTWGEWLSSYFQREAKWSTLIGATCLAPGLWATQFLTIAPWLDWQQAKSWVETPCTVTAGPVRYHSSRRGTGVYLMDMAFQYERDGKWRVSTTYSPWHAGATDWVLAPPRRVENNEIVELNADYALDTRHTCYVSPTNPEKAFMYRDWWQGWYLVGAFGPVLVMIGLVVLAARPRGGKLETHSQPVR
jgi:hypothetical protein